jgi:lipoprotein-anchoring transpeptidase ErfK/SrfK
MWLYGKDVLAGDKITTLYAVRPGDSMEGIGKKFKVPYEFLMEINGIAKPEALKVGQQLKVANGPFYAIVSRSTYTMDIYLQTTYVQSFKVGLGKAESETPTGLWRAALGGKMIKPRWTDPKTGKTYKGDDPDYPLGSRWIALDGIEGNAKGRKGFAIHGTKDPQTIGTRSSQGCIRLFNGEVIMVYNMMMPGLSEVRVVD